MNKYDFGYELHPGSTIEWAYHLISPNSLVLEVGPSNGNLISHLTQEKGCTADIVEISEESGQEAAQFARIACLGEIEGNLERDEWVRKLSQYKYDYIVILDVLEHVFEPEKVLVKLRELLCDDGTILMSVPNIAHNSILINLLTNKFVYTPVGLLDNTHIHFYTYESLKELLNEVGLVTKTEEVIQKQVGENEVPAYYGNLPADIESYLKTRPLGTAYQYLFQIKKGTVQPTVELCYTEDKNYSVVAFLENAVIYSLDVNPLKTITGSFMLEQPASALRLDPLDKNCILEDWEIQGYDSNDNIVNIISFQFTGNSLNGKMVFYDDDPQIFIEWASQISRVQFRYKLDVFDNDALRIIMDQKDYIRELERFQADAIALRQQLEQRNHQLASQIAGIQEENSLLKHERSILTNKIDEVLNINLSYSNHILSLQTQCTKNADNITDIEQKNKELTEQLIQLHSELEKQHTLGINMQAVFEAAQQREQRLWQTVADEKRITMQAQATLQAEHGELLRRQEQIDELRQQVTGHKLKSIWKILSGSFL